MNLLDDFTRVFSFFFASAPTTGSDCIGIFNSPYFVVVILKTQRDNKDLVITTSADEEEILFFLVAQLSAKTSAPTQQYCTTQ
jgi:hypothetical protein